MTEQQQTSEEKAPSTDDLMASLMGAPDETNGDSLFGAEADPEPPAASSAPAPAPSSILEQSGLLTGIGGGGGLFDDIDAQEKEEEERLKGEAVQKAKEERRAKEEAEARAKEELQRQEQQLQQQMQNVNLGQQQQPGMVNHQMQYSQPGMMNGQMMQMNPQMMMQQGNPMMQQSPMGQNGMQQPQMMNQPQAVGGASMNGTQQQQQMGQQPPQMQNGMDQSSVSQPGVQQPSVNSQMQQSIPQSVPPPPTGSALPPTPPRTSQPAQQPTPPSAAQPTAGFYRDHNPVPPQQATTQSSAFANNSPYPSPMPGSYTAGMHNANPSLGVPPTLNIQPQAPVPTNFGTIVVGEPLLLQGGGKGVMFGGAPYWSYQITTQLPQAHTWIVRRRFRHVVALEDRLREDCPGAILPPRPDKYATRAIEEATTQQSTEFAMQRAAELGVYLNQLAQHPLASKMPVLSLFLSLQDDLGLAWPEVSSNALKRFANASVGVANKAKEQVRRDDPDIVTEDSAELFALYSAESVRMGAVLQAVPKMEGAVTLMREQADQGGNVALEVGRLSKELLEPQPELDVLSNGLLRSSRRSKRLAFELGSALNSFVYQLKICRYERMAFADRKNAITKRARERGRVDQRAAQMYRQQQQQGYYNPQQPQMMGQYPDLMAAEALRECQEIGARVQSEVARITWQRKTEWSKSVKVIASAMKEAATERVAIWESVLENFDQTFPGYRQPTEQAPPVEQVQIQQQQAPAMSPMPTQTP